MSVRTHLLPLLMLVLGLAIIVRTATEGGGAGFLIGGLLAVAGGARLWAEERSEALRRRKQRASSMPNGDEPSGRGRRS